MEGREPLRDIFSPYVEFVEFYPPTIDPAALLRAVQERENFPYGDAVLPVAGELFGLGGFTAEAPVDRARQLRESAGLSEPGALLQGTSSNPIVLSDDESTIRLGPLRRTGLPTNSKRSEPPNLRMALDGGAPVGKRRKLRETQPVGELLLQGSIVSPVSLQASRHDVVEIRPREEQDEEAAFKAPWPDYIIDFETGVSGVDFDAGRFDRGRVTVHTVCPITTGIHPGEELLGRLGANVKSKGGGLIIFLHGTDAGWHFHVLHGCNFAGNRCQCFRQGGWLRSLGEPTTGTICYSGYQLGKQHWKNLWFHCTKGKGRRALVYCQYRRGGPVVMLRNQDLVSLWDLGDAPKGPGFCSDKTGDYTREESLAGEAHQADGQVSLPNPQGLNVSLEKEVNWSVSRVVELLSDLAEKYYIGEFNQLLDCPEVIYNQKIRNTLTFNMSKIEKFMENALTLAAIQMKHMEFLDICKLLEGNSLAFSKGYMSREDSFEILLQIFRFQHESDYIPMFLKMVKWFDHKMTPIKKNTWLIVGPPDSAKTWFATAWKGLARFTGKILNYTRGGQFCFGGIKLGRLILHDECIQPIEAAEYIETLKQVYAGSETSINVKFKDPIESCYMPVIATANDFPVRNNSVRDAFDSRWTHVQWSKVDSSMIDGKCHPMALYDLYNHCIAYASEFELLMN